MKKLSKAILAAALVLCFALAPAMQAKADAAIYNYYSVDYYVVVDAPDYYVNFRYGPSIYESIICAIDNGNVLHIFEETFYDPNIDATWGKTEYNGHYGWVSLSQCSYYEYSTLPAESNYYPVNYDVIVSAPDNYVNFRDWYSTNSNIICPIYNGEILHITTETDYDYNVGGAWGQTTYGGTTGWVSLSQCSVYTAPVQEQPTTVAPEIPNPVDFNYTECKAELEYDIELSDFLITFDFGYTNFSVEADDPARMEYDYRTTKDGDATILANIIGTPECADWRKYPVEMYEQFWENSDPLKKGTGGYKTCKSEDLTWIAKNIFHVDDAAMISFMATGYAMFSEDTDVYSYDGKVYAASGGIGGWEYRIEIIEATKFNSLYFITYDNYPATALGVEKMYLNSVPVRHYAVLEKKAIDGKEYWTMYSNSTQEKKNFDSIPVDYLMNMLTAN